MTDYTISLKPVYSRLSTEIDKIENLPQGLQLSWHQLETLEALRDPTISIVFNTAMTGDGKSLAAFLETLIAENYAIALYPTNELARDQEYQIRRYIDDFQPPHEPRVVRVNGADLELYAEQERLSKGAALRSRAAQAEIFLSNPDIFHYLHRGAYLTPHDNPDKLWNHIDKNFDLFIIDEFHVCPAPQVSSILNTIFLIQRTNSRKKFLFLSATPNLQFLEKLEKANISYRVIDPVAEKKYAFPDTEDEKATLQSSSEWRQIARAIDLNFIPLESRFAASEDWLRANQHLVLQYFLDNPGSKGAIVLNSIAAVKRLVPLFTELFATQGLIVGENTGLSGRQTKLQSLECDLVLGTSTIDIGVDFKINLAIFESADAGNFIQRLGRLGRHDSYEKEGQKVQFSQFTAYALAPKFLVERLFEKGEAPFQQHQTYDRILFNRAIYDNYRRINNFEGYYRRWAGVQSFKIWYDLGKPGIQQQYLASREKLREDCETVFETTLGKIGGRIRYWQKDWKALSGKANNPIFEDASSFRGSSPLQCGLYDITESFTGDRFKTYDLPGILSNLDIEMQTEAGFMRSLLDTAKQLEQPIAKSHFQHCLAFMTLKGYREERLNWKFTYRGDLKEIADAWKVRVLIGIEVWQPDNRWIDKINQKLRRLGLVSYVLPYSAMDLRQRLQLPMHFALYPIADASCIHDPTPPYSIAIGQAALLLDTLAYRFKGKGDEIWIC